MSGKPIQKARRPQTDFGIAVDVFCARHGMRKKELAEKAGVRYGTLCETKTGGTPGYELVEKVEKFMEDYEAKHQRGS